MKKFILITQSESSDNYTYFIKADNKPLNEELEKFLLENGNDIEEDFCYERIISIEEIKEENFINI